MKKELVQFIIFFVALIILIGALQIQILDKQPVKNDKNYLRTVGAAGGGGGTGGLGTGGSNPGTEGSQPQTDDGGIPPGSGGGGPSGVCGDGKWTKFIEGCDDGNKNNGDGCSSTCSLESGWTCNSQSGEKSYCSFCGDGILQLTSQTFTEACDDGNKKNGDGCSTSCTIEPGYACTGSPSVCSQSTTSTCGNGILNSGESCDDENILDLDGCSAICQIEQGWTCLGEPSECIPSDGGGELGGFCGNGEINPGEQCDDDNSDNGDGCSSECQVETDIPWVCTNDPGSPSYCTCEGSGCIAQGGGAQPPIGEAESATSVATAINNLLGGPSQKPISLFSVNDGNPLPEETTYVSLLLKQNDKISLQTKDNINVAITVRKITQDSISISVALPGRTEVFSLTNSMQLRFLDINRNDLIDLGILLIQIKDSSGEYEAEVKIISLEESVNTPKETSPEVTSFITEILQNSPELTSSKQISKETETQRIALALSAIGLLIVLAYIIVRHVKHHKKVRKSSTGKKRR